MKRQVDVQQAEPSVRKQSAESEIKQRMSAFTQPSQAKSIWQLANTLIPFAAVWWLAWYTYQYSYWLTLPFLFLGAGFVIRTFIIFHDCGHGSFFRSRKANDFWGTVTGILTWSPYHYWKSSHAKHHATSSNLDKRGFGDVWMMTVSEYKNATFKQRLEYRLYRNPLVMFLLGPLFILLITHRIVRRDSNKQERMSVHITNLGILVVGVLMSLLVGWKAFLLIQLPMMYIALACGIWLFYVQHQFEGVYWSRQESWDFITASFEGGSYYDLPAVLNWFTGSIGYHHVHHANPRVPNYHLAKCHGEVEELVSTPTIGFWSSFKSLSYRLWDEESNKLVSFSHIRSKNKMKKAA